jgi:ketosteroid isomerase-like protein
MSEENAELVPEYFAAYDRGGLDALAEYWHPAITWRAIEGALDDVGVMEGVDALRRHYEAWEETFDEIRTEVEESIDADDRVIAVVRLVGRMKGSESEVDIRYAIVFEIRDRKIVSGREYFTRAEAFKAGGLDP